MCILIGCASTPEVPVIEKTQWEKILDEIPWENRILGSAMGDENNLPDDLFSVLYGYGYQYVNSTHKIRLEDELAARESIYEIKREDASYDESDDTFMFAGEFYPDGANIWLIFSKDKDYELFAEPDENNKKDYRRIKVSGMPE
ncbi:hypothetical protein FACS189473_3150 [Spirochaetia bacterium]|nr:hypothetical protein FACS189473_3150 [Spirochaetia bacterium]